MINQHDTDSQAEATMRRHTLRVLSRKCALLGSAAAFVMGCSADVPGEPGDDLATSQEALNVLSSGTTWGSTIPVCWDTTPATQASERAWVQDQITRTWDRYLAVEFTGWGQCSSPTSGVRIIPQTTNVSETSWLGRAPWVIDMKLDFSTSPQTFWGRCADNSLSREACIRSVATHEFGHVLGFAHEQNQVTPVPPCPYAPGGTGNQSPYGYDAGSIMTYCVDPATGHIPYYPSTKDYQGAIAYYGAEPYHRFLLQTGTGLAPTGANFEFAIAPNNRDLFAIKKYATGSGRTEVHVLSAASNYQTYSLQIATALGPTDSTYEFALAPNRDLFVIKKSGTGSGRTEVHVLSAASNYQTFILQTGTGLGPTDSTYDFAVNANRDLYAIKKSGTGSGRTEVHVLSAASNYQTFSLQVGTALGPTNSDWSFAVLRQGSTDYVVGMKRRYTGTGSTELHFMAYPYQSFAHQTGTALHETDSTFAFDMGANGDFFAVKKSGTGTARTELHVMGPTF